jgi:glucose/galactose transporter
MGICNKVAGILAGLIFGYITLGDADKLTASLKTMDDAAKNVVLTELASRVIVPYIIITSVLVVLAIAVMLSSLPDINEEGEQEAGAAPKASTKKSIFEFPHMLLGVLALFLYVGVEVMAVDTIIPYGQSLGIELSVARYFSQIALGFMLLGYGIGIVAIPKYISQELVLKICAISGAVFVVLAVLTQGMVSVAFIALLGLSNSLIWPAVWPLALDGVGKFTKLASGMLVMAIAGGAVLPLIYSYVAKHMHDGNNQTAYWILAPCYLFILYFGTKGHLVGRKK